MCDKIEDAPEEVDAPELEYYEYYGSTVDCSLPLAFILIGCIALASCIIK